MTATITLTHADDDTACPGDWDFGHTDLGSEVIRCQDHERVVQLHANPTGDGVSQVVIYGGGSWGKGLSRAEAYRNYRDAGGRKADSHAIVTLHPDTAYIGFNPMRGALYVGAHRPDVEYVNA